MARNQYPAPVMDADEYMETMAAHARGQLPGDEPRRPAPGPTLSCPESYCATAQRAPYLEPQELSKPSLSDGVAFRQKC